MTAVITMKASATRPASAAERASGVAPAAISAGVSPIAGPRP